MVWFLRNVDLTQGLADVIDRYRDGIEATQAALDGALSESARMRARAARVKQLEDAHVPAELARRIANLPALLAAPDIRWSRSAPENQWPISRRRISRPAPICGWTR